MNNKYELTDVSIDFMGKKLFQIKAKISFWNVSKGEVGGYIEKESNLSVEGDAWVSGNACVYGDARVYGNAWVYGDARVEGNARVYGDAWVSGNARVEGNARVYGDARVYGNAWVYGDARVYGNARVYGDARVEGDAWVYGNARLEAKNNYTKGKFIGGDDTKKITIITDKTGSDYWKVQYVLGEFEITPQEEEIKIEEKQSVTLELTLEQIEQVKKQFNI